MTEKNTLLIVDDYEFNRLMLCDMFPNYSIIEAETDLRQLKSMKSTRTRFVPCCLIL